MKRIVISLILMSMALHCASRLGILSYLYSQRYETAYAMGLIDERPIAICDSKTDVHKALYIAVSDHQDELPGALSHAVEIQLFIEPHNPIIPKAIAKADQHHSVYHASPFESPDIPIFLPPKA